VVSLTKEDKGSAEQPAWLDVQNIRDKNAAHHTKLLQGFAECVV
jgi:hypothetical protein